MKTAAAVNRLRIVAQVTGGLAIAATTTVLLGWILGVPVLMSILPGWPAMSPLTAVLFLAAGASLLLVATAEPERSHLVHLSRVAAGLTVGLALTRLVAHAFGVNLNLDTLGLQGARLGAEAAGHMVPATAASFAFIGSALALAKSERSRGLFQSLAITTGLLGWLGIARHVCGGDPLVPFADMPVHTAGCLLLMSIGVLCVRVDGPFMKLMLTQSAGGRLARRLIPQALVAPLVLGWLVLKMQQAGWVGIESGVSLLTASAIVVFEAMTWSAATVLHRSDRERGEVRDALRAAHAKLNHLLMHSPALIYTLLVDDQGISPVVVSDNVERLLGYSVEEARSYQWWLSVLHPEDRERVLQTVAKGLPTGGFTFEYRVRHKDGTYRWVEDSNRALRTEGGTVIESVGVMIDVTERKRTLESLELSQERFRQLAENIREVFWMTDPDKHEMLYVSPAYEAIWGRSCESLYDSPRTWMEAVHPEDRARVETSAMENQARGTYDEEYRILRPDGSIRWIHDRAVPISRPDGTFYRVAGVAEDVTSRRKLEEQYRQAQKLEAIGQLAGGVAHDFNNILCVIQGHCTLLPMNERFDPSLQEAVTAINHAAERAATLTRQLLAFSRRQALIPRDIDMNDLVQGISKMLRRVLAEDVRVELRFCPEPVVVHADAGMLEQVILNLAVNARDSMSHGGRLVLETSRAEFDEAPVGQGELACAGSFVCLSVSDTGCGIPPDDLPRIFEPFYTTKDVGKGTGLGLSTVHGIVEQHEGWVSVYSEIGSGTTFRVFLPRVLRAAEPRSERPDVLSARGGTETILLAEDDAALRSVVVKVLSGLGYRVIETGDGGAALTAWDRHRDEIRLLLTDLVMPGEMNGTELARRLRQDRPDLRVIYTSGYSPEISGREMALEEGVNFISKPFNLRKLTQTVRESLDSVEKAA